MAVAVERHLCNGLGTLDAQVRMLAPAQCRTTPARVAASRQTALRQRGVTCIASRATLYSLWTARIDRAPHDIGADGFLGRDTALGTQSNQGIVDIAGKFGCSSRSVRLPGSEKFDNALVRQ